MAVLHSPESAFAKESVKWEAQGSSMGPGLRPYVKREYPMMLHRAGRGSAGPPQIVEQVVVDSETQRDQQTSRGFRATPLEAIAQLEAYELECATLAAERHAEVRHMSSAARVEVAAAEAQVGGHLPSVPVTPIKRRGRPPGRPAGSN